MHANIEQYQDIWIKNQIVKPGVRECAERYKIIKKFCAQFKRPFTVLDLGANLGYFSFRIAEDFPQAVVVMIESSESSYSLTLEKLCYRNNFKNIIYLKTHITPNMLEQIAKIEHFDVVLCLSVIHHIAGDPILNFKNILAIGEHVILELPLEKGACNVDKVEMVQSIPAGELLGYGQSHIKNETHKKRPIYYYYSPKNKLEKSYYRAYFKSNFAIYSDFNQKKLVFQNKPENRDWLAGINLWTFCHFKGIFPNGKLIYKLFDEYNFNEHQDVRIWNVILQGQKLQAIDWQHGERSKYDPTKSKQDCLKFLRGERVKFEDAVFVEE